MPKTPQEVEQIAYALLETYGDYATYLDFDTNSPVDSHFREVVRPQFTNPKNFKCRFSYNTQMEAVRGLGADLDNVSAILFTDTKHLTDLGLDPTDNAFRMQMSKGKVIFNDEEFAIQWVRLGGMMGAYWMLTYFGLQEMRRGVE